MHSYIEKARREARVCENRHAEVFNALSAEEAQFQMKGAYCPDCGKEWHIKCPNCSAPFQVIFQRVRTTRETLPTEIPSYCRGCGCPLPWTEKAIKSLDHILDGEPAKKDLIDSLPSLLKPSASTATARATWLAWFAKAAPQVGDAVKQILIAIGTEFCKEQLGIS